MEEIADDIAKDCETIDDAVDQAEVILDLIDFEVPPEFKAYVLDMVLDHLEVYLAGRFNGS